MSKKPTPMCAVPVNHVVISAYEYRILIEDLQRFCGENAKLRQDLSARIGDIGRLEKELEKAEHDLEEFKRSTDFWYKKSRAAEDALKAIKEAANATPENT